MAPLRILLDHNMAIAVGKAFADRGHAVERVVDTMTEHEVDGVIWGSAVQGNVVVVSFDRDFRTIARTFQSGQRGAFKRRAGLISLSGLREPMAAKRVAELMPEIELAQQRAADRQVRFTMSITATSYTVVDNAALRPEEAP